MRLLALDSDEQQSEYVTTWSCPFPIDQYQTFTLQMNKLDVHEELLQIDEQINTGGTVEKQYVKITCRKGLESDSSVSFGSIFILIELE